LKLDVQGTAGCTFTKTLPSVLIGTFEVQLGPLPIVVVLQGALGVEANVQAGATFDADVAAHAETTGGISYDKNGGLTPIDSPPRLTFPTKIASFNGTADAYIHVVPTIEALLYGVAGAEVKLTTGVDFHADTASNPWWKLTAPVDITGALTIPGLDKATRDFPIYTQDPPFTILTPGGPFGSTPTVSVTNPGDQTSTVGTAVNVQIHASDSDSGTLIYSPSRSVGQ
jgi:hypothetical protein